MLLLCLSDWYSQHYLLRWSCVVTVHQRAVTEGWGSSVHLTHTNVPQTETKRKTEKDEENNTTLEIVVKLWDWILPAGISSASR